MARSAGRARTRSRELQALIAADDYAAAFDLARAIERVTPRDPLLRELEPSFAAKVRLDTAPDGAKVFHRPYAGGEKDWRFIGETPLVDVAVPIGVGVWRLEKEGHDTALLALRNPGLQLGNSPDADVRLIVEGVDFTIPLADSATSPHGMVLVPMNPALLPGIAVDLVEVPRVLPRSLRGPQSRFQGIRRRRRIRRGRPLAGPAVRRRGRMADRRRRVRRSDWPARPGDVARGHLSGRHGRPPRDRCQLVRGGGVLSIQRQGVADGPSLGPRRWIDFRVLGIGFIGDRARQQFRWSGTRAGRPVWQRRAARHL